MFDTRIAGIPCKIDVLTAEVHKGSYSRQAETPDDYYGYKCIEFNVCDRKGRLAPWLEAKMTEQDVADIEYEIIQGLKREDY